MTVVNNGASFGLDFPAIEFVSGVLLILLLAFWYRQKGAWGVWLMVTGGSLNLCERIVNGGVRDYWKIPFTSLYNNINDYLIALGVIQLVWYIIWKKRQT